MMTCFQLEFNMQAKEFRNQREIPDWIICDDLVDMFLKHKDRFGPDFTVEHRNEIAIFSIDKKLALRSHDYNYFFTEETTGKQTIKRTKKQFSWLTHSSIYGNSEAKEFSKPGKFLHFYTCGEESFSLEQMQFLARTIKTILEEELGFEILPPIIVCS